MGTEIKNVTISMSVAAINKKLINKTVILKSSKNIKITNLAKKIIKLAGSKSKIIFNKKKERLDDFTSNALNIKKKEILYGWKPKNNLDSGLLKYIKYIKNNTTK